MRAILLVITILSFAQPPLAAESSDPAVEIDPAFLKQQCRQLKEDTDRQLATCRTVFQLGEITARELRQGWEQSRLSASMPKWVPALADLARGSSLEDRALPILNDRQRTWKHGRGQGGEYRSFAFFHEGIAHSYFIEALERAGFAISEWTSVPSRQAHALLAGNQSQTHIIVASQPETCRSLHLTLTYHSDGLSYPHSPSPFEGQMTEVQVAYREP